MQKKCQETIWAVINCSLTLLILHRTKKEAQISLFQKIVFSTASQVIPGKQAKTVFPAARWFFSKIFLWPHMFLKNVLLSCTKLFSKSCGPFAIANWRLSNLTKWENVGLKIFSSGKVFFSQALIFSSIS